ncbi:50S ribosomal protein L9 [Estrella lausannensis]|uniref:Large ribosomal subunit protein bL9 n=1 Tax=Estrella lausannensis TaxID=483423 RepID=A0A0H5DPL8_9BACT|nr:50S ribosomal protein L9 [Estrella lausannensis]CRX38402.1 50S ribosomal protein L9 [Estrella lausannensis]
MATKLLLIEDIEDLGRSGDLVSVREGYARNFLLPRGAAVIADKNAIRRQAALQEARRLQAIEDKKDAEVLAAKLEPITIHSIVKVDHEGHMYGSVTAHDICKQMEVEHGIHLEKRYVQLKHPVKALGIHKIELRLKEGVPASITLKISAENMDFEMKAVDDAKKAHLIAEDQPE